MAGKASNGMKWGLGAIAIVGAVALFLGARACGNRQAQTKPGTPSGAWWIETPDGGSLVVADYVRVGKGRSEQRMVAVDVATGQRTATRLLGSREPRCAPAVAGRIWCRAESGQLALHDARTLASVIIVGDAIRRSGLGAPVEQQIRVTREAASVQLDDGRVARLDAATLAVAEDPSGQLEGAAVDTPAGCAAIRQLDIAGTRLSFGKGPRAPLIVGTPPAEGAPGDRPGATFLKPSFLGNRAGALRPDATSALVAHETSLDQGKSRHQVSRIDQDGQIVWTAEIVGACQQAALHDGALVIATRHGTHRARAIDLATGAIRWQLTFD